MADLHERSSPPRPSPQGSGPRPAPPRPPAKAPAKSSPLFRLTLLGAVGATAVLVPLSFERVQAWLGVGRAAPSRNITRSPTAEVLTWVNWINAYRQKEGVPLLTPDPALAQVANAHTQDMLAHNYFAIDSPRLGTHRYRLWKAGVTDTSVYAYIFKDNSDDIAALITSSKAFVVNLLNPRLSHIAVGIAMGPSRDDLVGDVKLVSVVLMERQFALDEPTRHQFHVGSATRVVGRLASGFSDPHVIVTRPDGRVEQAVASRLDDGRFGADIRFTAGTGKYKIEVEPSGVQGPVVTNLFPVYVGVPYPPPDVPANEQAAGHAVDVATARREMFMLLNEERRRHHLPTMRYDGSLEALAQSHSDDMRDHDFFAHISPHQGDLEARARREGLVYRIIGENIAIDRTILAAHQSLMESPGHRANILSEQYQAVGIGIAQGDDRRYGKGALWVTQHFATF